MAAAGITGIVSQIQPFSVHDGDGIRTTIFLAGCPLRCLWCANPETWGLRGTAMTVREVVRIVMRNAVFFRASGGGVTFSGGEATAQPEFLKGLIDAFEELGTDMALETAGIFRWADLAAHLPRLSLTFADIKHMDTAVHRRLTGSGNSEILQNIRRMGLAGIPVVIRIPLIPGMNDSGENLRKTARFAGAAVPGCAIEILPYHDYAVSKYHALGLEPPAFDVPTREEVSRALEIIASEGIATVAYR